MSENRKATLQAAQAKGWGAQNVTVRFTSAAHGSSGQTLALKQVGIDVVPGRVTAVVGGDGAGKSTLLHVLLSRIPLDSGTITMPPIARIGYQPSSSGVWRTLSVDENLDFVGEAYGMTAQAVASRKEDLLERAKLREARDRLGGQLSGGMRQKLGFCMAMLHDPEVLLLDEPSTGVDPVSRVELWRLIAEAASAGTAVVMTTTYLDEAERAEVVLALDAGTVLAVGAPADVIDSVPGSITISALQPNSPDDDARPAVPFPDGRAWRRGPALHAWSPIVDPTAARPDLEDAIIALSLAREVGPESKDPEGNATSSGTATATARRTGAQTRGAGPLLDAKAVVKRFGHFTAVDNVSLKVEPGEIVGLLGANGAGKTTLIRILLGLETPSAGSATVFGSAPTAMNRHHVGYVPQGLGLFNDLTVEENVAFVASVFAVRKVPPLPAALDPVRSRLVKEIGLGRQRQLAFHCALLHSPRLLVLDEPTSGVDPLARARLWDTIHGEADSGVGVLVTTHYMQEAEQCSRVEIMAHGLQVASGAVADIVEGKQAIVVRAAQWEQAFAALGDAGLPVVLDGRTCRVAGSAPADVERALSSAGVAATLDVTPATLEETMVLADRAARDIRIREGAKR